MQPWPAGDRRSLTDKAQFAVIAGFPKTESRPGRSCFDFTGRPACSCRNHHETHLPSFESPPRTHARVPCSHEDAWRPCRHQCPACQGPQASFSLNNGLPDPRACASFLMGRLVRPGDFQRVLAAPAKARTVHFAVHHLVARPSTQCSSNVYHPSTQLSTVCALPVPEVVDDLAGRVWLGSVVPRRHARRSVTRSLLKRQIRAAIVRQPGLPGGLWVVRLRAPFERQQFTSAASQTLRRAARTELDALLADAVLAKGSRGRQRG